MHNLTYHRKTSNVLKRTVDLGMLTREFKMGVVLNYKNGKTVKI